MPDLDYVKVIGRFGIVVRDAATDDPNEEPDTIWCDEGQVLFTPLVTSVKVVGATPVPATLGQSTIAAEIDAEGYLSLRGSRAIYLVDLTSDKVNPFIGLNKATHKIEFQGLMADGQYVNLPSPVNVRLAADMLSSGVIDLTLASPVPVAGGTAQIVGPPGPSAYESWLAAGNTGSLSDFFEAYQGEVGPPGPSNFLVYENGEYPSKYYPNEPHIFVGPVSPDDLGLMSVGDTWVDTSDSPQNSLAYLRLNEIGSSGTPGGDALDDWFNTKIYEDPTDPGTYLIGG